MLICSFVYAQNVPLKNKKGKKPTPSKKNIVVDNPKKSLPPDSLPIWLTDTVYFDPMDTAVTVRISKSALNQAVTYHARDSQPYYADTKTAYLYGDAVVEFGDMKLRADFIKIEFDKTLMTATGTKDSSGRVKGKPVFKQGQSEYKADIIKYNYKTKNGYLSDLRTKEGEGYIHGSNVKKNEDNNMGVSDAKYTTCDAEHPHYYIGASKIKVIPNKKIITGPANLWIEDVPTILALPFGIFPLKKGQSSGIIIPQYGNSQRQGYFLRNGGYYFALGPHHDLQFNGDIFSNLSWAARTAYRYTTKYRFSGNLNFNYNANKYGLEEDPEYFKSNDFQLLWSHRVDPKARPNTTFSANVNIASSSYLQNNSYVAQNIVTNQLNSSIAYNKSFKNGKYNLSSNANMSQNTTTHDLSLNFPELTFTVSSFAPFKPKYKNTADKWYENITTNYTMNFKNNMQTKDTILFRRWSGEGSQSLQKFLDTATRYGMVHSLPIQTSFKVLKFYTLSASVNFNDYMYMKTIRKDTLNGVHNVNSYGFANALTYSSRIGLSTRYYGMAQFGTHSIRAIRHVMTPTLAFTYVPDFGDSKYGYYKTYKNSEGKDIKYSIFENGIFGGPSSGRQGNISLGLDNNLEMKIAPSKNDSTQTDRKIQIFESISASTAYNIFADSLKLNFISISGRTRLFKNISINGSATLDPYYNYIYSVNNIKYVTRQNTFYINKDGSIGSLNNANMGLSAGFNPTMFKSKKAKHSSDEGELKYINEFPGEYYDFNIPWNFNVNYTISYNKYNTLNNPTGSNYVQTLNFNGDLNLTKNWKIGYSSGYDILNNKLTFTSIDFVRNLHCWEFKLNWIPIGPRQSFMFNINVKSTLLQDLKMTRRRDWFDRPI